MAKTTCPITRTEFATQVIPSGTMSLTFDAAPREFSTGSLGWGHSGKETLEVNGKRVVVQVSLNVTIVGSKELPK